jgi:hypothetical protein
MPYRRLLPLSAHALFAPMSETIRTTFATIWS